VVVLAACGALSSACGGASRSETEQASLRHRVDELERKVDAIGTRDHDPLPNPSLAISGVVLDTDGMPASGVVIAVAAGDMKSEGRTDSAGRFEVHAPAGGEAFLYAHKNGKSAHLQGAFNPATSVTLNLVEPGTIEGTFEAPDAAAPGKVLGWITPGRVPALLPGLWGHPPTITGNHFKFESVPAGDVEIHLFVGEQGAGSAAHALVHVEPGHTATVRLDPTPATASVVGQIQSAGAHEIPKYGAFLLMPDGSPEAEYPVNAGHFGFGGRSPGNRVLLFVAHGFKPRRVPVMLEANRETDLGDILLEPLSMTEKPNQPAVQ